jgi:secondary thiamine-phosphate synthase enzyme
MNIYKNPGYTVYLVFMREIKVVTRKRNEMVDITNDVQEVVEQEKIDDGFAIVYVPHTTAGITINEGADPSVQRDIVETLKKLVPETDDYHHMEGNSDAHIKASILGSSVAVLIKNERLVLGTWQHIFFYEGDGPRTRKVLVKIFSF